VEEEFKDSNYGTFKKKVADEVEKLILPLQEKYNRYRNSQELYEILEKGSKEATKYASNKIEQARNKLGIKY
jgi:tryptophanyl-tRNA synthetase